MDVNEEFFFFFGGGGGSGPGGQGRCERRSEVFVKIQKKIDGGGGGGGVWVDVVEELKFLEKFTKKKFGGVRLVGGQGGCQRNVGGRG